LFRAQAQAKDFPVYSRSSMAPLWPLDTPLVTSTTSVDLLSLVLLLNPTLCPAHLMSSSRPRPPTTFGTRREPLPRSSVGSHPTEIMPLMLKVDALNSAEPMPTPNVASRKCQVRQPNDLLAMLPLRHLSRHTIIPMITGFLLYTGLSRGDL
jgi:hypothetical protein